MDTATLNTTVIQRHIQNPVKHLRWSRTKSIWVIRNFLESRNDLPSIVGRVTAFYDAFSKVALTLGNFSILRVLFLLRSTNLTFCWQKFLFSEFLLALENGIDNLTIRKVTWFCLETFDVFVFLFQAESWSKTLFKQNN